MTESYVAAVDQGTTSTRCMLFDRAGRMVSVAQLEHHHHYPRPGWVEHDADRGVAQRVPGGAARAAAGRGGRRARSPPSGIANQRETTVVWDPRTGRALRTGDHLAGHPDHRPGRRPQGRPARGRCSARSAGSPRSPYFAGPRLRWLLDHVPGLRERAAEGNALFGTMETWLIWNLTGGPDGGVHVTDVTNASRTMLMDLRRLTWDQRLLDALDVPGADAARDPGQRRGLRALRHAAAGREHRRRARRPAGRAVRADLLRRRRGQVHLRHRRVPADERRRPGRRSPPRAWSRRSPTSCPGSRRATPWRARSRWPARWCSGCATRWR